MQAAANAPAMTESELTAWFAERGVDDDAWMGRHGT